MNGLKMLKILKKEYPRAKYALRSSNPLQTLVATILSAQCTDKRVNEVTKQLFKKYRKVEDYARARRAELEKDIRPTGFYRQKAKFIQNAAKIIIDRHRGRVPRTMEELTQLPGVARKTANIVLGNSYGVVEGIPVDTHVKRLSYRMGLTENTDPVKIEKDLMGIFPKKEWFGLSYFLIEHGRAVCKAPTPLCSRCVLNKMCPKNGVKKWK